MNVLDILKDRGFVDNTTHEDELRDYLAGDDVSCYIGFDPTADSLHVGHLIPIMSLAHMQKSGHRPIALVGGGTGKIGDPSGKTEMRNMLTLEDVEHNKAGIRTQLGSFLDFSEGKALLLDNAEWLDGLQYIPFLREVGRHFSVNRMVKAESYRNRLESEDGLSFLEFNYMIFQAYDFLELSRKYNCCLQMGGSDQWGNIVAGVDLIRRSDRKSSFGMTYKLITTSSGAKMGKTAKGAVWLDPAKTSPYDYYQFWINTDDADVVRFLSVFTFLPMEEIAAVEGLEGSGMNDAKAVLAYEATLLAHGEDNAKKSLNSAVAMFGDRVISESILPSSTISRVNKKSEAESVPTVAIAAERLKEGIPAFKLFFEVGLAKSGGEARKLITQGGAYMNDERLSSFEYLISEKDLNGDGVLLRAGKKRYFKVVMG